MSTVRLVATKAYTYSDRSLKAGDVFEASEKDAKLLTMIGSATVKPADNYLAKVLQPSEENHSEAESPKPKRQYRRRDLVPEV